MLICLAICCPVCAWGEESGADQPALPQEVADLADQGQQAQNLWQQGAGEVLQSLWQHFSGKVTQPLQLFLRMGLLLVFAAVAAAPASGGDRPFLPLVEMVCFLACAGLCIQPLQQLAEQTRQQILACKSLLLGSVPVLASVLAGGGQPASAAVFSGFFLSAGLVLAELAAGLALPLVQILLALHTAAGACEFVGVGAAASLAQRTVKWLLGLVSALFAALLGVQNIVAGASDSLAMKTGKFLLSSSIPIVGQAVSGAVGAVNAGLKAARSAAGLGLLASVTGCFLPVVLQSLAFWMALSAAAALARGLDCGRCAALLKGAAGCASLCGLILLFYALPVLLATVAMMNAGGIAWNS